MTTLLILFLAGMSVIGFTFIELFLWLLEVIFATLKYIICYLIDRPCNWKENYLGIRIIFTWCLKWLSFAELSPKQIYKHRASIAVYMQNLVIKQGRRKDQIMKRLHRSTKPKSKKNNEHKGEKDYERQ